MGGMAWAMLLWVLLGLVLLALAAAAVARVSHDLRERRPRPAAPREELESRYAAGELAPLSASHRKYNHVTTIT